MHCAISLINHEIPLKSGNRLDLINILLTWTLIGWLVYSV